MGGINEKTVNCEKMALDFFESGNFIKTLDIILDIYDEIRCFEIDEEVIKKKFFRVLNNLKKSDSLFSLLEKDDRETLYLFLEDFLGVECDGAHCYIKNECFSNLTSDELYSILIQIKYSKGKEMINQQKLSI